MKLCINFTVAVDFVWLLNVHHFITCSVGQYQVVRV